MVRGLPTGTFPMCRTGAADVGACRSGIGSRVTDVDVRMDQEETDREAACMARMSEASAGLIRA